MASNPTVKLPGRPTGAVRDQRVAAPQTKSEPLTKRKNLATRHHYAARMAPAPQMIASWYEITDPSHMPDLHGQLGGVKVHFRNGKQMVQMTDAQARFYLDSGSLAPYVEPQPEEPKPEDRRR